MEEKQFELTTPVAVIVGSLIISASIVFTGSHVQGTTTAVMDTATQPQAAATQPAAPAVDSNKVVTANEPFIGDANAKVTIAYWFDYQCPFCKQNELQSMPQLVKDYVDTGKAKIVFKDFEFLGADSQTLGQFARAVWAVAPDKFYDWHHAMFAAQGTENTGWATHDEIMSVTTSVLGAADANKVNQLVISNGPTYQKAMDADKAEGGAIGVSGTPAFVIGTQLIPGAVPYAQIQTAINTALAGK